jgi:hypothetical protein
MTSGFRGIETGIRIPLVVVSRGISGIGMGCANDVLDTTIAVTATAHLVERCPCMSGIWDVSDGTAGHLT